MPLPAGVRDQRSAQELQLGPPAGGASVLLPARAGGSVPRARVPHPTPVSLHPFHDRVQRPTAQGGAPRPGGGGRLPRPPGPFSVGQGRREFGLGGI